MNEELDLQNLLLLYLADELPLPERRRVDQMLVEQPAVRAALIDLQSAQDRVAAELAGLDALSGPINGDAISRRVGRALRQELARPRSRPSGDLKATRHRVWPWVLPTAAASIVVAAAVWIDRHVGIPHALPTQVVQSPKETPSSEPSSQPVEPSPADTNFALWIDSFDGDSAGVQDLANSRKLEDDARTTVADTQDAVSQYLLSSTPSRG